MATWNVQAPDGKVIQFPDNFTEQDVNREMGKLYGAPPPPNAGLSGPSKPNVDVQYQGSVPSRVLTAMGAAAGNLPNPVPGQGVGQYDPKTRTVSGLTPQPLGELKGAASGIYNMIAEPAQRIGGGDIPGGLGQAAVNIPAAGAMMKSAADMANLSLPSKARAQANYTDLKSQMGGKTIDTTISRAAAESVVENAGLGGQLPKVVRDFIRRTDAGDLTYAQAQKLVSNATRKTAQDVKGQQLTPAARADMVKFAAALRGDITASVEGNIPGAGAQYAQANREYGSAMQMRKAVAGTAAGGAALAGGWTAFDYIRKRFGF